MSPIIDIYCHIFPQRFFDQMTRAAPNLSNIGKRLRGVTKLFDLDARFKEMDQFGDYRQIISLPNPAIEDITDPRTGLALARIANDAMAELCRKHPERFPTFAAALCITRGLGYTFAGLTRRFLVRPGGMIWPGTLMSAAMFTTLHKEENAIANGWKITVCAI